MRDKNATKLFACMVVALAGLWATTGFIWSQESKPEPAVAVATAQQAAVEGDSTLRVAYPGVTGKSALTLLKETGVITTDNSRIVTINGVKNGTGNKFWMLYINNTPYDDPNTITNNGDSVQWKFE